MKNHVWTASVALLILLSAAVPALGADGVTSVQPATTTGGAVVEPFRYENGHQVLFDVNNPTGSPAVFSVSDLGISYTIPPMSKRTFFVDLATVSQPQIAYTLQTPDGTQLASGTVPNDFYSATGTALAVDLEHIINYSTAYSYPVDPEPLYSERPASYVEPSRQTIRGYW